MKGAKVIYFSNKNDYWQSSQYKAETYFSTVGQLIFFKNMYVALLNELFYNSWYRQTAGTDCQLGWRQ